jgi:hypothetical protein
MVDAIVTDAKAEVSKVKTWLGQHWPHFVTWITLAWTLLKSHL